MMENYKKLEKVGEGMSMHYVALEQELYPGWVYKRVCAFTNTHFPRYLRCRV